MLVLPVCDRELLGRSTKLNWCYDWRLCLSMGATVVLVLRCSVERRLGQTSLVLLNVRIHISVDLNQMCFFVAGCVANVGFNVISCLMSTLLFMTHYSPNIVGLTSVSSISLWASVFSKFFKSLTPEACETIQVFMENYMSL